MAISAYQIAFDFLCSPIGLVGMDLDSRIQGNIAFIDGQNLHLGTKADGWAVDHYKFRTFLEEKYEITEAYYFLGYASKENLFLYSMLRDAGFILLFKDEPWGLKNNKRGNVDCDIIFEAMKALLENKNLHKIYLVSGDGDYKKLLDFLIDKEAFGKILFPNQRFASSIYKNLNRKYIAFLSNSVVKERIEYIP